MRRRLWLVPASLVAAVAAVVILAWSTSPDGTGLGQRLHARLEAPNGRPVALSRVAPWLRDAVVATEDERFYRHHGNRWDRHAESPSVRLGGSLVRTGASTITEQVAKVLYLSGNDHCRGGSVEDAAVVLKLEDRYDKEQILAAYLRSSTEPTWPSPGVHSN